jgi:hypothetical protein
MTGMHGWITALGWTLLYEVNVRLAIYWVSAVMLGLVVCV